MPQNWQGHEGKYLEAHKQEELRWILPKKEEEELRWNAPNKKIKLEKAIKRN